MIEGVVFSKVFGTELYEVAGIGVNWCSTLLFSDLICVAIKSQHLCSIILT